MKLGLLKLFALAFVASCLAACSPALPVESETLKIYASTGYLADAVKNIAPNASLSTMVGPGGDPHTYQPSTKDAVTIKDSDVVFWLGLNLEAQMVPIFQSLGEKQLAVGELIPKQQLIPLVEQDHEGEPLYDPHIWNSPELWQIVVQGITNKLVQIDPQNAEEYQANSTSYLQEISELALELKQLYSEIPLERRVLITGHDAFGYLAELYDLEVFATDFISTEAAITPRDISNLAQLIVERRFDVIFRDNQVNPQAITSLQEAVTALHWQLQISPAELFADSLGVQLGVDTYLGVLKHNAVEISTALRQGSEQ